jgi:hypothetical protein
MAVIFSGELPTSEDSRSAELDKLYVQIGQLKVENDFLKKSAKKLGIPQSEWKP